MGKKKKEKQDSSVLSISALVKGTHFFSNQLFVTSQEEDVIKPQASSEGKRLTSDTEAPPAGGTQPCTDM